MSGRTHWLDDCGRGRAISWSLKTKQCCRRFRYLITFIIFFKIKKNLSNFVDAHFKSEYFTYISTYVRGINNVFNEPFGTSMRHTVGYRLHFEWKPLDETMVIHRNKRCTIFGYKCISRVVEPIISDELCILWIKHEFWHDIYSSPEGHYQLGNHLGSDLWWPWNFQIIYLFENMIFREI